MHVSRLHQEPVRWKRDNLAAWRAAHGEPRRAHYEARLAEIFALADEVPILREALDWAREHGIEFIIDRTTKAGAYYSVGSGVVAIAARSLNDTHTAVTYLVHEIRHAWQDYYHMIPTVGTDFPSYFMRQALIEADATAHQMMAGRQYDTAMSTRMLKRELAGNPPPGHVESYRRMLAWNEKQMAELPRDAGAFWFGFTEWFASWKPESYGNDTLNRFAQRLGIPGIAEKDHRFEYNAYELNPLPEEAGIDVARMGDLRRLGKTFNGMNYFNADKARALTLDFTAAARAQAFYTLPRQTALAEEVRRRWLLLSHHKGQDVPIFRF